MLGLQYLSHPDQSIFYLCLATVLDDEEKFIADGGYSGPRIIKPQGDMQAGVEYLRARHLARNGRFKSFNDLMDIFRHNRRLHGLCF